MESRSGWLQTRKEDIFKSCFQRSLNTSIALLPHRFTLPPPLFKWTRERKNQISRMADVMTGSRHQEVILCWTQILQPCCSPPPSSPMPPPLLAFSSFLLLLIYVFSPRSCLRLFDSDHNVISSLSLSTVCGWAGPMQRYTGRIKRFRKEAELRYLVWQKATHCQMFGEKIYAAAKARTHKHRDTQHLRCFCGIKSSLNKFGQMHSCCLWNLHSNVVLTTPTNTNPTNYPCYTLTESYPGPDSSHTSSDGQEKLSWTQGRFMPAGRDSPSICIWHTHILLLMPTWTNSSLQAHTNKIPCILTAS